MPIFLRKFATEPDLQRFHTYRELILGAHLREKGVNARYEIKVGKKTPDWVVLDNEGSPIETVDVFTLHQRREKGDEMAGAFREGQIWSGWIGIPPDHIYRKLEEKGNIYAAEPEVMNLPYVLAVFGEFTASIEPREIEEVLYRHHGGVFSHSPAIAGVIYFRQTGGDYEYTYFPNANSNHVSAIVTNSGG